MKTLLTPVALIMCIVGSDRVEASVISVDAYLSHPDLSLTNPIEFTVRFPTSFVSIDSVTVDSYFVGDGLDASEVVAFTPGLAGFGVLPGGVSQFFRRLTFPASLGFDDSPFLDGRFDGIIFADRDPICRDLGLPCPVNPTVTFEKVVFTVDGEPVQTPTPVPEPATLVLLVIGLTPGVIRVCARNQSHARQDGRRR